MNPGSGKLGFVCMRPYTALSLFPFGLPSPFVCLSLHAPSAVVTTFIVEVLHECPYRQCRLCIISFRTEAAFSYPGWLIQDFLRINRNPEPNR